MTNTIVIFTKPHPAVFFIIPTPFIQILPFISPYFAPVLPAIQCRRGALRTGAHALVGRDLGQERTAFDSPPPKEHSLRSSVRKKKTTNMPLGHGSIHSVGSASVRHFVRLDSSGQEKTYGTVTDW